MFSFHFKEEIFFSLCFASVSLTNKNRMGRMHFLMNAKTGHLFPLPLFQAPFYFLT